jgi:hypothetical protein
MEDQQYRYDVAFSFLKEDEPLAERLNDLLKDRVATFLYSKRQEELAGTDGEVQFNEVFGEESRIVVVLFRAGWGSTPWTRIEETAIRNRAYSEGYDFVVFVPLDEQATVPKWLPKNRIWVGLARWGETGAASVIEARIQEFGGTPIQETMEVRAQRMAREVLSDSKRAYFLGSSAAVDAAKAEVAAIQEAAARYISAVRTGNPNLEFNVENDERNCVVSLNGRSVSFAFRLQWANSLDGSALHVTQWKGTPGSRDPFNRAEEVKRRQFNFDIDPNARPGWSERNLRGRAPYLTTEALVEDALTVLMRRVQKDRG